MRRLPLTIVGIIVASAALFSFMLGTIITQGPISAEEKTQISTIKQSPFVGVAKKVLPGVVNISAERMVSIRSPGFQFRFEGPFEDFFRRFFEGMPPMSEKAKTLGSGFVIDPQGYIVTNYHVIKDAEEIIIKFYNGDEYKGDKIKIIGTDSRTDIALIKVDPNKSLPSLDLGRSKDVEVGEWAIAVGNPYHFEGTVTVGVISAKGRSGLPLRGGPVYQNFLQTDAAINPGNSGGPLVNINGEVIGINTAITSPSGGNVGIGFAIPIDIARGVIQELKEKGKVERGYLGVYPQEITDELKEGLGLSSTEGILIRDVLSNTPAEKAGLKAGDVIIKFDKEKVTDVDQFRFLVADVPVGKKVEIVLLRDGKRKRLYARIGQFPEETALGGRTSQDLGLTVIEVSDPKPGVIIRKIKDNSPADQAGLKEGDLIVKINNFRVKNLKDYRKVLDRLKNRDILILQIDREGQNYFVTIRRK